MKYLSLFSILFFFLILGCDVIENPKKKSEEITCGNENDPVPIKKILIEDYTGHKCPNCPDAAIKIDELIGMYCDHIIPISLHVGYFASPDTDFPADYRTETGNNLNSYYTVTNYGLPNGLVNRTQYNGNYVIGRDNWATAVHELLNTQPLINIIIESSYNETDKQISVEITTEMLSDINEQLNIGLYITEDSIVSPQKNDTETIDNYIHRHVLRKGITPELGENLSGPVNFGTVLKTTYTFAADSVWNIEHCHLLAFVSYKNSNEIIQAESEPIIQHISNK
jgi:hypothetical protein